MADTVPFSEVDLLCPQCSGIYYFPVVLKCGHNVCRVCLQKFWEWKGCRECPVCRTVSILGRPPINLALKIAADEYQAQRSSRLEQGVCALHSEKLKIFCQNDEEPICLVCYTSKQHKVHECCPVEEAAQQKKTEISATLESLRKNLKLLQETKDHWEETKSHIQVQSNKKDLFRLLVSAQHADVSFRFPENNQLPQHLQTQACQNEVAIKEEFEKLHLFLREEETTRLQVLKQEEEIKTQVMTEKLKNIQDQIKTLAATITEVETALTAKDLPFLQDYKATKKRVKCNIRDPECIRHILIDSAKHLGSLKFEVWRKMVNTVRCVPIVLDPNTAHGNLKFSEELTCVRYSKKQLLPDNPERCTSRMCVLGAAGFTSGKHSWTVDVGDGRDWNIGVAAESIRRKTVVFLSPAEGFWVIGRCKEKSYWAHTSTRTKLVLKQKPERITVKLDCDKGKVVFINAADLTTIHTFSDKFTERVFPYLSPGLYEDGITSSPLIICPLTVQVTVE